MTKTNENPKPTLDALKSSHEFTVLSAEEETELTGGGEGNETAEPMFKCPALTYWSETCGACIAIGTTEQDC